MTDKTETAGQDIPPVVANGYGVGADVANLLHKLGAPAPIIAIAGLSMITLALRHMTKDDAQGAADLSTFVAASYVSLCKELGFNDKAEAAE